MQKNNNLIKILIGSNVVLLLLIFIFLGVYLIADKNKAEDTPQTQEQTTQQTPAPVFDEHNTIKEFLANALKPVGNTMYVYGGGIIKSQWTGGFSDLRRSVFWGG